MEIENKGKKRIFGNIFSENNISNTKGKKSMNSVKNNIMEMAQENLYMYKRLRDKQPTYDLDKYLKDYNQNQYYKKNLCRFPSINFYKENGKKFKNNKHKTICSFSVGGNTKKDFNTICKTDSNYFPKITRNITTLNTTNNNTCENYRNKCRIFKGRKKKFENFTFKDLKNLKIKKNKSNVVFNLMRPSRSNINYDEENIIKNKDKNKDNDEEKNDKNSENKENKKELLNKNGDEESDKEISSINKQDESYTNGDKNKKKDERLNILSNKSKDDSNITNNNDDCQNKDKNNSKNISKKSSKSYSEKESDISKSNNSNSESDSDDNSGNNSKNNSKNNSESNEIENENNMESEDEKNNND